MTMLEDWFCFIGNILINKLAVIAVTINIISQTAEQNLLPTRPLCNVAWQAQAS